MEPDDMKKAGDVLLADTSPASSGSLYSCELCSLPASYLHLSVSNATHLRNSHSSNKLQIPAEQRPKMLCNAVEIISWIISISAWRTEEHDVQPSDRTSFFPSFWGRGS